MNNRPTIAVMTGTALRMITDYGAIHPSSIPHLIAYFIETGELVNVVVDADFPHQEVEINGRKIHLDLVEKNTIAAVTDDGIGEEYGFSFGSFHDGKPLFGATPEDVEVKYCFHSET